MTFLVQKDRMDIISKVQRDVYLTTSVYALQEVITVTGLYLGSLLEPDAQYEQSWGGDEEVAEGLSVGS